MAASGASFELESLDVTIGRAVSRRDQGSAPASRGTGEFTMDYGPTVDPEPVSTIAWRLAHLIGGFAQDNASRFGGPPTDVSTYTYAGTAKKALEQLDHEYGTWIQGVRSLGTEGLTQPQGPSSPPQFADAPMARLFLFTSVELIHHGAEICLLRDLYLRNGSDLSSGPGDKPAHCRERPAQSARRRRQVRVLGRLPHASIEHQRPPPFREVS